MGPRGTEIDESMPEDVAALYSWANLTGAKYRDYSAARREQRAQMRYRAATRILEKELAAQSTGEAAGEAATQRIESARRTEAAARAGLRAIEAEREITEARESGRRKQGAWEQAEQMRRERTGPQPGARSSQPQSSEQADLSAPDASPRSTTDLATLIEKPAIPQPDAPGATPQADGETALLAKGATPAPATIRPAWLEPGGQPGWSDETETTAIVVQPARTSATAATLLESREQVALRRPVLQMLIRHLRTQGPAVAARMSWPRGPVVAIVSPSGGAGKTSLAAALTQALANAGERVLAVEGTAQSMLPLYFGMARTASPAVRETARLGGERGAVSLTALAMPHMMQQSSEAANRAQEEAIETLLARAHGCDRIVMDISADAAWAIGRLSALRPMVLAAITPDINSVAGLQMTEPTFAAITDRDGRPLLPFYLLNQFDAGLPLHLDIREVLGKQLGERLLAPPIRRSAAIGEALAEGTTVVHYAADSPVTRDLCDVASWLAHVSPASAELIAGARRDPRGGP